MVEWPAVTEQALMSLTWFSGPLNQRPGSISLGCRSVVLSIRAGVGAAAWWLRVWAASCWAVEEIRLCI